MTTATSSDGRLLATTDDSHAGVTLQAFFAERIVRTNLVSNPKLGTNSTYWNATNNSGGGTVALSRQTSGGPSGSATFARCTWSSASTSTTGGLLYFPVSTEILTSPGQLRSASVWVRCSKSQRIAVTVTYLNSGGTFLSSTSALWILVANTWTEIKLDQTTAAPANTVRAIVSIYSTSGTGSSLWANGDTLDATELMVHDGATAYSYFDGATTGSYSYRWTGTANASTSQEYVAAIGATMPLQVTFERDGVKVRSGDPAWAPGGNAVAYDHEAPLGVSASWRAQPVYQDGTTGAWTATATLTAPAMADDVDCWVKPLDNPGLAVAFQVHTDRIEEQVSHRVQVQPVQGRALPAGTFDKRSPAPLSITFRTNTKAEKDALAAALDVGYVLIQLRSTYGIDDFYAIPLEESRKYFLGMWSAVRDIPVTFQPVLRAPTLDAPLRIPGHSYADSLAAAATYAARLTLWPTYADVLGL